MKVELHLHTSRYSPCAVASPAAMMRALIDCGYGAAYLTEHDQLWRDFEIDDLQRDFPAIRIFGGVELTVGSHHIVVLGTTDRSYLQLEDEADILAKAGEAGHAVVLAHPYRWPGGADLLHRGLRPDGVEYLTNNQGDDGAARAAETAAGLGIPLVNASDAHDVDGVGRFWIETDEPLLESQDILSVLRRGAYRRCPR